MSVSELRQSALPACLGRIGQVRYKTAPHGMTSLPTNERARLATLSHLAANFARSWLSCSLPVIDSLQFGLFARHLLLYRVVHLVANLSWVDMNFDYSTVCLILPGLMGVLAEAAGQLGKMVELPNPSQPNPGSRPDGPPCTE